jgi:dTDP-4-dehydrorhamnose reductase
MKNRMLLTGARGMFGRDAEPIFSRNGFDVAPLDLPELDIADAASFEKWLDDVKPQIVVNAAAFTDVDGSETMRDEAFRANSTGAGTIAGLCGKKNAFLAHISTDYVFPGTRSEGYLPFDVPGPAVNAYGESKLEGEKNIVKNLPGSGFLICRTQWLYGRSGRNFVNTVAKLSGEKETLDIVNDQWGVPTWTKDVAEQMCWLLENKIAGLAHTVGGGGPVSWFDFGKEIVAQLGAKCEVLPIASDRLNRPATRPRHGWLRNDTIPDNIVRNYKKSLSMYLKEENFL